MCYKKIKSFFLVKRKFVKVLYEVILSCTTLITSIATIYLMCIQNDIQSEANRMHIIENSPLFSVEYELLDMNKDSIYDTRVIEIYNLKNYLSQPASIDINVFYKVEKIDSVERKNVILPINAFYWVQYPTTSLEGKLLTGYLIDNWNCYVDLKRAAMLKSSGRIYYDITKYDLIKIDYVDIYNNENTAYFQDKHPISERFYNDFINNAIDTLYDVEKISMDDIILILEK